MKERWHERQFTRILLKIPQAAICIDIKICSAKLVDYLLIVQVAFNSVRSMFRAFKKEQKGFIDFNDLYRVFEQLDANFSAEEISQVFKESDMMENGKFNFNEFILCLAIGFVLHKIPFCEGDQKQHSIFSAPM